MFSFTSTPIFSIRATSLSIASSLMRKAGITCRTMPPRRSAFSNSVTGMPARPTKYAADMPVGPPPHDGHLPAVVTGAGGVILDM